MLKVGDMVAVRYERENLDRAVYQNDRVTIQYAAEKSQVYDQGKEPAKDRGGRDMQMERTREMSPR
jgi:cell filamentation protein